MAVRQQRLGLAFCLFIQQSVVIKLDHREFGQKKQGQKEVEGREERKKQIEDEHRYLVKRARELRDFNMLNMCTHAGTKWHDEHRKGLDQQLHWIAAWFKLDVLAQTAFTYTTGQICT